MTRHVPIKGARRRASLALAAVAACAISASAVAQPNQDEDKVLRPPKPRTAAQAPVTWNIVAGVLLGGLVLGTAMIPSKRGHQD